MEQQILEYKKLVKRFFSCDLDSMNAISKKIVTKFDDGKLFSPFVPLVGGGYRSTRLMIYGMAHESR